MTLCIASQRVFIVVVYFVMTQYGNFWIHRRISLVTRTREKREKVVPVICNEHHAMKAY
jgi:hypothetical protein